MTERSAALASAIERKRDGGRDEHWQIEALVRAYTDGELAEEEFAVWLRAVMVHGLDLDETIWLTQAMAASGTTISWNGVRGPVVDKHSTGGVSDGVTLIAVPLAAACGVKVAKLAGRALGHTGGTIDKLECIPGLRSELTVEGFRMQVAEVGCAIAHATSELAPADKKIYALRHRTNAVADIGLITSSVLSKKIAGGAPALVIDVKCGRCAFMQTQERAEALARSIAAVGWRLGRRMRVVVTNMDEPLGSSVGDALELDEALTVLKGAGTSRLREVALAVADAMLALTSAGDDAGAKDDAQARMSALETALRDGSGLRRFAAMVSAQGGDLKALDPIASPLATVNALHGGYVNGIDGAALGAAVAERAASRMPARAPVGVRLRKRVGDAVQAGEPVADVYGDATLAPVATSAIEIGERAPGVRPAVLTRIDAGM